MAESEHHPIYKRGARYPGPVQRREQAERAAQANNYRSSTIESLQEGWRLAETDSPALLFLSRALAPPDSGS
jgi:hypothetical protein